MSVPERTELSQDAETPAVTTAWEYKIIQPMMKGFSVFRQTPQKIRVRNMQALNDLGAEGWECFHVDTASAPQAFYLKRKR